MNFSETIQKRINDWLDGPYDEELKEEIRKTIIENPEEAKDAFYTDLDFGTGGLRGIMGPGPNRMNKYTVGAATQGLANYIMQEQGDHSVAIAYDCRNNSRYFAQIAADVLSANGIKVYLFDELRPTPELSFAVRHYHCSAGIVITASHNPKEYNGYKVYWNDGAQLVPPHDKNVIDNVRQINSPDKINFSTQRELIEVLGKDTDELYLQALLQVRISEEEISRQKDMGIVYTPLHGTGVKMLPAALRKFGFKNIINVPEQDITDGNFPTVKSPNPEEPTAFEMALAKARETNANIILATDPDSDRIALGVKLKDGSYKLLNGNQTACILGEYTLSMRQSAGTLPEKRFMVKTIVTTDLFSDIARNYNTECFEVLTGFKYIAELIRKNEGKAKYLGGGEESYGYLGDDFIRDKDALMSACQIAEIAAWTANQGMNLYEYLESIYRKYGYYSESLISITKKGISGKEEIQKLMSGYRENPPKTINGIELVEIRDYQKLEKHNILTGKTEKIDLPESNVLQFILSDKSKITVRPSGTEPKIKFYFSVFFDKYMESTDKEASEKLSRLESYFHIEN
ncbi:MAG: phosphoglucomutase [Marinilabiliales bacterium]|nr:MAG: phosphoglucomutase [Marinilabiliales bacterium]